MTEEEIREAEELEREINSLVNQINYLRRENSRLEVELDTAVQNVGVLTSNCATLDKRVFSDMDFLSKKVGEADLSTKHVFQAINELTNQYFTFKRLSTASKNVTQFTDEYNTKFSFYDELRRISLGYIVALDAHIISSESARKKVEKAYLQNTEYWLAYAITSVMLWASDEREAAERALSKSLSMSFYDSCLFYLLVNLRFGRIEAAKKWYITYLEKVDMNNLGEEWQYLLQAYLMGAFGLDHEFNMTVSKKFEEMLQHVQATTVGFSKQFSNNAKDFAVYYAHKTRKDYVVLGRTCKEYGEMLSLLTDAEKNAIIAKYYNDVADEESEEAADIPQRIENVFYDLINSYEASEEKLVEKIKFNEAIISAAGDSSIAQANFDKMKSNKKMKKNFGQLISDWAFISGTNRSDVSVKRFAISFTKESIAKGFMEYIEAYRGKEKEKYTFDIDDCILQCSENDVEQAEKTISDFHDKNKWKNAFSDKYVKIAMALSGIGAVLLLLLLTVKNFPSLFPVFLITGSLLAIVGVVLFWRRLVDLRKILETKKQASYSLLRKALGELALWRKDYKEADSHGAELLSSIERF